MSTQTIERNYRKNPHTATFLQTFHSGISSTGRNYRAELATQDDNAAEYELAAELAAEESGDLLNLVPAERPAFQPSPAQVKFMTSLLADLFNLDREVWSTATDYTARMNENNAWTPGRNGNVSRWIDRLIAKRAELRAAAPVATPPAPVVEVADGRYAVEHEGTLKFYRVKNGHRAGFVFLDVQASDDWHAIRNLTTIRAIVALIAIDPKAAMVRYGHELGECGRCGRTLTDEASRAAGIGPICASK